MAILIDEDAKAMRVAMDKLDVKAALLMGGVVEIESLMKMFATHGAGAMDIREKQILGKIVRTLAERHAQKSVDAFNQAKLCGAVEQVFISPATNAEN